MRGSNSRQCVPIRTRAVQRDEQIEEKQMATSALRDKQAVCARARRRVERQISSYQLSNRLFYGSNNRSN